MTRYSVSGYSQTKNVTFVKPGGTTTTTTTLPGGSTSTTTTTGTGSTSTTLPVQCADATECDDGDPCTQDVCAAGTCAQTPVGGAACGLPPDGLGSTSCSAVPAKIDRPFDKAAELLGRALDKPRKVVKRLVKKADKLLRKAKKLADAAELLGKIPPGCADDIGAVIDDVRSRVGFVLEVL